MKNTEFLKKPEGIQTINIAMCKIHSEYHELNYILRKALSLHGIKVVSHEISYDDWATGNFDADIWLGSANFSPPADYSVFSYFIEIPLFRRAFGTDWTTDMHSWRKGELSVRNWVESLITQNTLLPLFHNRLFLQETTTLRGVYMNSLGWFDFKSVWNDSPELKGHKS